MKDNIKSGDKLPYLKQIITLTIVAWLVAALTSGFVLDTALYVFELYTGSVRQFGWYTFSGAVGITLVILVSILVREVRK